MSGAGAGCLLTHSEICSVTSDLPRQKLLVVKAVAVLFFAVSDAPALRRKLQTTSADVYLERDSLGFASQPVNNTPPFRSVTSIHTSNKRARMFSRRSPTHTLPCRPRSCRRDPAGNGGCYIFNVYGSQISARIWARGLGCFFFCMRRRKA